MADISWTQHQYSANGVSLNYYQSINSAVFSPLPILFFLHAMWLDGATLVPDAVNLAQHFTVVLPDARCHGFSKPVPSNSFVMHSLFNDAASLIRHVGEGQKVYLIGTSMGAAIAARVAKFFPEIVKAVIIDEPPWTHYPWQAVDFASIDPATHTTMPNYVVYLQSLSVEEFLKIDLIGQSLKFPAMSLLAAWRQFDIKECRTTLVAVDSANMAAVDYITVPALIQIGDKNATGTQVNGSKTDPDIAFTIVKTYKYGKVSFYKDGNHVLHQAPTGEQWLEEVLWFFGQFV